MGIHRINTFFPCSLGWGIYFPYTTVYVRHSSSPHLGSLRIPWVEILPYSSQYNPRIICPQVSTNPLITLTLTLYVPQSNLELEGQVQVQNFQAASLRPIPSPASLVSCPLWGASSALTWILQTPHSPCQTLPATRLLRITACSWLQVSVPSEREQTQAKDPFQP